MSSRLSKRPCLIPDGGYRILKDDACAFVPANTYTYMPTHHIHRYPQTKEIVNDCYWAPWWTSVLWCMQILNPNLPQTPVGSQAGRAPGLHARILKLRNPGLTPCCLWHAVWSEASYLTSLCPPSFTLAVPVGQTCENEVIWVVPVTVRLSNSFLPYRQPVALLVFSESRHYHLSPEDLSWVFTL